MFRSHTWNIHVSKFIIWNLLPAAVVYRNTAQTVKWNARLISLVCTSRTRTLLTKSNIYVHLYIYIYDSVFNFSSLQPTDKYKWMSADLRSRVGSLFFFLISRKNGPPIPRNKRIDWCGLTTKKFPVFSRPKKNICVFHRPQKIPFDQNFRPQKNPSDPSPVPPPVSKICGWGTWALHTFISMAEYIISKLTLFTQRAKSNSSVLVTVTHSHTYMYSLFSNVLDCALWSSMDCLVATSDICICFQYG